MKLLNAYTVPYPPDMKLISEPGIPRAVSLTFQFDEYSCGLILNHGLDHKKLAQQLRQFANELDEL